MRITPEALEKLKEFLADLDDSVVRVATLTTGGG